MSAEPINSVDNERRFATRKLHIKGAKSLFAAIAN